MSMFSFVYKFEHPMNRDDRTVKRVPRWQRCKRAKRVKQTETNVIAIETPPQKQLEDRQRRVHVLDLATSLRLRNHQRRRLQNPVTRYQSLHQRHRDLLRNRYLRRLWRSLQNLRLERRIFQKLFPMIKWQYR